MIKNGANQNEINNIMERSFENIFNGVNEILNNLGYDIIILMEKKVNNRNCIS